MPSVDFSNRIVQPPPPSPPPFSWADPFAEGKGDGAGAGSADLSGSSAGLGGGSAARPISDIEHYSMLLLGACAVLLCVRLLRLLTEHRILGVLMIVLGKMLYDVALFLVIFSTIALGFGLAFVALLSTRARWQVCHLPPPPATSLCTCI